jgi:hypothetical protein
MPARDFCLANFVREILLFRDRGEFGGGKESIEGRNFVPLARAFGSRFQARLKQLSPGSSQLWTSAISASSRKRSYARLPIPSFSSGQHETQGRRGRFFPVFLEKLNFFLEGDELGLTEAEVEWIFPALSKFPQMSSDKSRFATMNGIDAVQFLLILGLHESLARSYDNIVSKKVWGNPDFIRNRYVRATGITPEERHRKRAEAKASLQLSTHG